MDSLKIVNILIKLKRRALETAHVQIGQEGLGQ